MNSKSTDYRQFSKWANTIYFLAPLILHFLILPTSKTYAQSPRAAEFRHLTVDHGLSNSWVRCILKDSKGFMWFGTANGLNRYDGVEMKIYKREFVGYEALTSNFINCLYEDHSGNIWIGTQVGLNVYDCKTEKILKYEPPRNNEEKTSLVVSKIVEDDKNTIWIGTSNGMYRFIPQTNSFKHFSHDPDDTNSLVDNLINDIEVDKAGNLWIGTRNGVNYFEVTKNKFTTYKDTLEIASMNYVMEIYLDKNQDVWIGTVQGGELYRLNKQNTFERIFQLGINIIAITQDEEGRLYLGTDRGIYKSDLARKEYALYASDVIGNILGTSIRSIFYDPHDKILWSGTENGGVNYSSKWGQAFQHYKAEEGGLSHRTVFSIVDDPQNIWVATFSGGLNVINKRNGAIKHYLNNPNANSLSRNEVTTLEKDRNGNIWIGTYNGGLDVLNVANGKFTNFINNVADSTTLGGINVYDIHLDKKGNLWIATEAAKGLSLYHPETGTFSNFQVILVDTETTRNNWVRQITEDENGNLLIITFKSIQLFNTRTHTFTRYMKELEEKIEYIQCILLDSRSNLWIGTNSGLYWTSKDRTTYKSFFEKDGLPSSDIAAMLEDEKGNLWVSTKGNGLFKFVNAVNDPTNAKVFTYSSIDGLQGKEYVSRAAYKGLNNTMYFGGQYGLNVFNSESVLGNKNAPPVVLTSLKIFNKEVPIGNGSPLKSSLTETETLTLSYEHYVFTINFAALNFLSPHKNQYAYILENFEENWNYVNTTTATYTNLSPGTYTFRVKASNNYGVWNEEGRSLVIIVKPPYWQEWWFRILVTLLGVSVIATWYIRKTNEAQKQKAILEEKVLVRTRELQEANELLTQQKEMVTEQKEMLREQSEKIESLYTEVMDSILAAEAIQTTILPSEGDIKKHLPDSFIFNRPKDVVSGDFYWFEMMQDKIAIAVADCTGHGVSGAFMAIKGYHLLNEIKYTNPQAEASILLNQLNKLLITDLHKNDKQLVNNGMDIAMCTIDLNSRTLHFAGANSPLYVFREGKMLYEIKGNPISIGHENKRISEFTGHSLSLEKGDIVYLFSDGYADQFGGEDGDEKLKYPRFRKLLTEISILEMEEQSERLDQFLQEWKKDVDQIDDILIVGFKI